MRKYLLYLFRTVRRPNKRKLYNTLNTVTSPGCCDDTPECQLVISRSAGHTVTSPGRCDSTAPRRGYRVQVQLSAHSAGPSPISVTNLHFRRCYISLALVHLSVRVSRLAASPPSIVIAASSLNRCE